MTESGLAAVPVRKLRTNAAKGRRCRPLYLFEAFSERTVLAFRIDFV